ncbi:hypothetical protein TorRG33x02_032690 [Trema orientale]|uniref:Uncharacterized protein n=1 Tax=Trema orientale TaxID=63057 RepID=A0A2P5FTG6_TREOI|nr:hypothetical protein TorRG33x02_032690 [Trema orientale]
MLSFATSKVLKAWKTVTVSGTGTSFTLYDKTTPKLAPPPPRIAQKVSSPIDFLSRIFPFASTIFASTTWSLAKPCFLNMFPYPPPLMCPPAPTVGQIPAGKPRRLVLVQITVAETWESLVAVTMRRGFLVEEVLKRAFRMYALRTEV